MVLNLRLARDGGHLNEVNQTDREQGEGRESAQLIELSLILQRGKLRQSDVWQFAPGHTARKW